MHERDDGEGTRESGTGHQRLAVSVPCGWRARPPSRRTCRSRRGLPGGGAAKISSRPLIARRAARAALDIELAAEELDPLAHPGEPEAAALGLLVGPETAAVVLDHEGDPSVEPWSPIVTVFAAACLATFASAARVTDWSAIRCESVSVRTSPS